MTLIGRIAKASRAFSVERGKRGQLVKWGVRNLGSVISSPSLAYEKSLCLCVYNLGYKPSYPREWYMLHMSSDKDKYKEEEEKKSRDVLQISTPEHRGSYLAFHHDLRHQGQGETPPPRLPLITKLEDNELSYFDTGFAVLGSRIFQFGGFCGSFTGPSKVIYYDATRPEDGWKVGPRTICGREHAAVAALHGKLYVFGGGRSPPDVWAEFLDTTSIDLEEVGKADWSPLHDCPALGFGAFFAAACEEGMYSGHILVGAKCGGPLCLYDVTRGVWKNLGEWIDIGGAINNPILVGTTIYWIDYDDLHLNAYDIVGRRKFSMTVGDFKICHQLRVINEPFYPVPTAGATLIHLAGDVFCLVWLNDDDPFVVHCTKLQVCPTVMDAHILCCHSYRFDHKISLLHCGALPIGWRG